MSTPIRFAALALLLAICSHSAARAQERPSALAPILVEPYDGKEVVDEQIVWSWFMQSRAANGQDIFCDLAVVEILEGQTAEEAMRLNPPVILRQNLTTSSWQTPAIARSLQQGKRYAWQITAKVRSSGSGLFQVVNQSELWELTYHDPALAAGEAPAIAPSLPSAPPARIDSAKVVGNDTLRPSRTGVAGDTIARKPEPENVPGEVPPGIAFSGEARHTLASENRRGTLSTAPARFDRLQIDPTITLFGVPLDLSLLISTESNLRQSDLSRGAFGTKDVRRGLNLALQQRIGEEISQLERQRDSASVDSLRAFVASDSTAIARRIAQLEQLDNDVVDDQSMEALQELNLLTPEQQTIARFPSFGFGKVAPNFGALLLDRVTINGGAVEYNPGNLYVAGAVGKAQRQVDPNVVPQEIGENDSLLLANPELGALEFFRNVYAARIGYGRRRGSYIALTGMYADDDDQNRSLQSLLNRPVARLTERLDSAGAVVGVDTVMESHRVIGRQRNYGFGGVGRLQQEALGLVLDGEFNLAYFDDDANRAAQMLVPLPRALPSFLKADSTLTDYNFALRADWKLPGTESGRLNAGVRYVGGGFRSVGVAGLRTDLLRADARYRTQILDRQVGIGLDYSFEEAGFKDSSNTSRLGAIGASVDMRFKGLPTLSIGYQRHDQNLEIGKRDTLQHRVNDNAIEQLSATLAYLRQWGGIRWSWFASALIRNGSSQGSDLKSLPDSAGIFRTRTLQVDNRVSFGPGLTLGVLGAYTGTRNHPLQVVEDSSGISSTASVIEESDAFSLDLSALMQPMSNWQVTLGAVVTYQRNIPQPTILGGYFSSQLQLSNVGTIELRFDYRESAVPDLKTTFPVERVGRVITSVRW